MSLTPLVWTVLFSPIKNGPLKPFSFLDLFSLCVFSTLFIKTGIHGKWGHYFERSWVHTWGSLHQTSWDASAVPHQTRWEWPNASVSHYGPQGKSCRIISKHSNAHHSHTDLWRWLLPPVGPEVLCPVGRWWRGNQASHHPVLPGGQHSGDQRSPPSQQWSRSLPCTDAQTEAAQETQTTYDSKLLYQK